MPDVSIIIPTLNNARLIMGTLKAMAKALDHGAPVEVVVVDSSSTDQTALVFNEIKTRFPGYGWRYVYEPMPGLLSGRHRGAKEARGEILSYVDDDVLLSPSWFEGLQEAFVDPNTMLATGPTLPEYEVEPPKWVEGLWQEYDGRRTLFSFSLLDSGSKVRVDDATYVLGHNLSIRRGAFLACGGFHPDLMPAALRRYQGDGETGLTLKARDAGLRALYHPNLSVDHVIPAERLTTAYLDRRAFYQGVCDSYTRVRRERAVAPLPSKSWKAGLRYLRSKLFRRRPSQRDDVQAVLDLMSRSWSAGFVFHQNEVRRDPSLLSWITKADYFDYPLPDGWQRHMGMTNIDKDGVPAN
jgi:glycosyltransferase involved in cell wall biosynthesis